MKKNYLGIGTAQDLKGKERIIYRSFEILPGFLSWLTILSVIFLSWAKPVWIAFFIISFDIYWLLKTLYFSFHLRASYKRMRRYLKIDWLKKLSKSKRNRKNWRDIYHLVILPMYKEGPEIVRSTIESLVKADYPKEKMLVVLTVEERAGKQTHDFVYQIREEFKDCFFKFLVTIHPKDIPGELAGKGSNETWAARQAKKIIIDPLKIPYENIIVSSFDIDTRVYPQYFARLTYCYLRVSNPTHCSFQPIPIYSNNIWQAPAISRVVATSGTFWHMTQQERPERMATFSSHSMSFKSLVEMDFWNVKNVSEDSRIFWKSLLFYDGQYQVVPLYYPVSMDANLAESLWQTMLNVYKQQRRWGWGVENIPYFLYGCLKNKKMPLGVKLSRIFFHLEGFWSWATNALMIFLLGWLPLILGGEKFNLTVLSYNLPRITRGLMTLAMIGLVSSAIYSTILLPPRPKGYHRWHYFIMIVQWMLLPITLLIFGCIPGLESQTRLLFGKYMGFWVTPKKR